MNTDSVLRPHKKTALLVAREKNRRLVLQLLFTAGTASRADLARLSGLSKATVSEICAVLLDEGLVLEAGLGQSTGGKPPTLLKVNREGRFIAAIDVSGEFVTCAVFGLDGRASFRKTGTVAFPTGSESVSEVNRLIGAVLAKVGSPPVGIGIASSGAPDGALAEMIQGVYDIPAVAMRSVDAAAIAEYTKRTAWGDQTMLYLLMQPSLPAALIVDGRLKEGAGNLGNLDLTSEGFPAALASRISPLISVLPDTNVVLGGESATGQLVKAINGELERLGHAADSVSRFRAGAGAPLHGAAGIVLAQEIGVVWR